jgi:membrane fusion protein (multidrug efflux system)
MRLFLAILLALPLCAQSPELVSVISKPVQRDLKLPGEFQPYETAELRAAVQGFVDKVLVDRGSVVKKGQVLAELVAPEMRARLVEAQAREQVAESMQAEMEARLGAARATYSRLKEASATPGAIAGNELIQAEKAVAGAEAAVKSAEASVRAARASVSALRDLEAYLKVTAPFSGVITERFLHPGALAGPSLGPLLKLEDSSRLRLVVAVPESAVGGIRAGTHVTFKVPAYPDQIFSGAVARLSHEMDPKTRTMPVEVEVANNGGKLSPGMYSEVNWPVHRGQASLLVPASSIVVNTERTFVIRNTSGRAEWINVRRGAPAGELVEVFGPIQAGDRIVKRASDEIREGTKLN